MRLWSMNITKTLREWTDDTNSLILIWKTSKIYSCFSSNVFVSQLTKNSSSEPLAPPSYRSRDHHICLLSFLFSSSKTMEGWRKYCYWDRFTHSVQRPFKLCKCVLSVTSLTSLLPVPLPNFKSILRSQGLLCFFPFNIRKDLKDLFGIVCRQY